MTVSSTSNRKTYAGDAATTSFSTSPVVFYSSSELVVRVTVNSTGVSTLLTEGVHYTVTGGSATLAAVGTVNLAGGSAPHGAVASGSTLVILRVLPLTQTVDFVNNSGSDAEVAEQAFDRKVMIQQQQEEELDRAIRFAPGDVSGSTTEIPDVTTRAGRLFGWDATGLLTTYAVQIGTAIVDLAASTGATLVGYIHDATGAVMRTVKSKLTDELSLFDFMTTAQIADVKAKTYTLDVSAAVSAAITAGNAGGPKIIAPYGGYLINSPLTSIAGQFRMEGAGRQKTEFKFMPSANGTCVKLANGAATVGNVSLRGFSIWSSDSTYVKTALELNDITTCNFEEIYIYGTGGASGPAAGLHWHDTTGVSKGIVINGRDSTSVRDIEVIADYPIYVGVNPNAVADLCENCDHFSFHNTYLIPFQKHAFTVEDGLGVGNLSFSGYNAWVGGTGGFKMNDTRAAPTTNTHDIVFENIRGEQGTDVNGYWFDITFVGTAHGPISFKNVFGATGTQGIKITKASIVNLSDVTMATAAGKNALLVTPATVGSVINMIGCYWQPASVVTLTDFLPASISSWDTSLNQAPATAVFTYKTANFGRQWFVLGQSTAAASGTAVATEEARATITVPKAILGRYGRLKIHTSWSYTNSANNKTMRVRYSTITGTAFTDLTSTTTDSARVNTEIANNAATNSQKGAAPASVNGWTVGTAAALPTAAVDNDTADTTVVISGQKATAGETLTLESYIVEAIAGG